MAGPARAWISDPQRMRDLGSRLAALLRRGDLVLVTGPLGAGKTTLVQGIGAGLGVTGPVTSPTFVIARVHRSRLRDGPALVHADGYRLGSRAELDDLDLDTDLGGSVTVVEWGEGLAEMLSPDYLHVIIGLAAARAEASSRQPPGGQPARPPRPASAGQPDQPPRPAAAGQPAADMPAGPGDEPRLVTIRAHGARWAAIEKALGHALAEAAGDHSSVLSAP